MDVDERLKKIEEELRATSAAVERELRDKSSQVESQLRGKSAEIERRLQKIASIAAETGTVASPTALPMPAAHSLPQDFRIDMTNAQSLSMLDELMEEQFSVQAILSSGTLAAYPTTYCETAREYVAPIIGDMPMSDAQREALLTALDEAAKRGAMAPMLASLGVHLPGIGCFVNGWIMARKTGLSPAEYFASREGFAQIVTTASHEKWGHGFISELTALGKEKCSVKLDMHHLADQFEVRTVDTPDHARLAEQWEILFYGSDYVEEGFATWIERYLAERLAERDPRCAELPKRAARFTAKEIVGRLKSAPKAATAIKAVIALFTSRDVTLETVHQRLLETIAAVDGLGDAFAKAVGLPGKYALGYCIVDTIAQRQGPKCVPFAVATACNIKYGLEKTSNQDLRNFVARHPNLNVNTRLAAMMFLEPGAPNDVDSFLLHVRDQIGLTPPK